MRVQRRLFILDNQPVYAQGLKQALQEYNSYDSIRSFSDSDELIKHLKTNRISALILGWNLPETTNSIRLLKFLVQKLNISVLVNSANEDIYTAMRAYNAGALGFITKSSNGMELSEALRTVINHERYLPCCLEEKLKSFLRFGEQDLMGVLTPQEQIILQKICNDCPSSKIADELNISLHTVNNHRKNILRKTSCKSVVSLVKYGLLRGYDNNS
ncbi:MAG: hypothetical protein COA58_04125 [Bacteroidetes bacterium]|nr:MAG: hypothetical protein COA58_04125 [Bacteroidota bacterium]